MTVLFLRNWKKAESMQREVEVSTHAAVAYRLVALSQEE
jgi:hypothetical protein